MSDNASSILMLGTKGVGKTTLLTVLGTKYERMGAFGLSMVPCDRTTQLFVRNAAHGMVVNHAFPAATDRSDAKPLSWDVLAGTDHLFRIFSLDCAGETISQVFVGDESVEEGIDEGTEIHNAKETLSALADNASAVCLVLAPHQLPGNRSTADLADSATAARMYEVDDLIHAAAHSPRFKGKRLVVVLTRTDEFAIKDEIVRLGGPRGYLRAKCPAFANSKRFDDAHVMAVAPVVANGGGGDGESQNRSVPDNFESIGLEDVLIGLGGAVRSPLAPLANAYRELRRSEWNDAQTLRSGGAADRLAATRRRYAAASQFEAAAKSFFDSSSADASVRVETELRIRESVVAAQVRNAEEEAVARVLTDRRAPSDSTQLRDALVSAALAAGKAVPGAPRITEEDLFLSSPDWAKWERGALPRVRRESEEALFAAIKAKDRIGAEKAYQTCMGIAPDKTVHKISSLLSKIAKLEYPDQIDPAECQLRFPETPLGRPFVYGKIVCRNYFLGYAPSWRLGHCPADPSVFLFIIPFINIVYIVLTILAIFPARKAASKWRCHLQDIQSADIKIGWFNCYLNITAKDGKKMVFATSKKKEQELRRFLGKVKKLALDANIRWVLTIKS